MDMNEYQRLAQRTDSCVEQEGKVLEGALGLAGEAGEFIDLVKKDRFQGRPLDIDHAVKELGDVLWYVACAAQGLGVTLGEVARANIDKLAKRYPEGFSVERSNHRAQGDI